MSGKLLWTGLTVMLALEHVIPESALVGSIIMIVGLVLMWLDK